MMNLTFRRRPDEITLVESSFRGSPTLGSLSSFFCPEIRFRTKCPSTFYPETFSEHSRHGFRINEMFLLKYPPRERLDRVGIDHVYSALHHDRAVI